MGDEVTKKTRISLELVITIVAFAVALTTTYTVQAGKIKENSESIDKIQSSLEIINGKLDKLISTQSIQDALTAYGIRDRWAAGCMSEYDIRLVKKLKVVGIDIDFMDIREIQHDNGWGAQP